MLSAEQIFTQLLSFILVATFLAGLGRAINSVIWPDGVPTSARGQRRLRWFWRRTMELHPILAGMGLGFLAWEVLPVPEFLGMSRWAAVLWFSTAGMFSIPIFRKVTDAVEDLDLTPGDD